MVCNECGNRISDPVCLDCYKQEVAYWLRENINNPDIITFIIRKITLKLPEDSLVKGVCALCYKQAMIACIDCYFSTIERVLQEFNIPDSMIDSFLEIFNYHLYETPRIMINFEKEDMLKKGNPVKIIN